jgi:hypothetical protein
MKPTSKILITLFVLISNNAFAQDSVLNFTTKDLMFVKDWRGNCNFIENDTSVWHILSCFAEAEVASYSFETAEFRMNDSTFHLSGKVSNYHDYDDGWNEFRIYLAQISGNKIKIIKKFKFKKYITSFNIVFKIVKDYHILFEFRTRGVDNPGQFAVDDFDVNRLIIPEPK